jgi:hypothetical protein
MSGHGGYGSGAAGGDAAEAQRLVRNAEPQLVTSTPVAAWWSALFDVEEDIDIEDVVRA